MKRIHIVGKKNSGKTTLVVDLVQHLTARGYRVGTVKHTHHQHELDTPGKDSYRHRQAGAAVVGILSVDMNAVFWPHAPGDDSAARYEALQPFFAGCDVLLVEGHYRTAGPKIEVWRAAISSEPFALQDPSILAVVTDDPLDAPVPIWPRSDVPALADRLVQLLGSADCRLGTDS
jgi:molybdopterin-guanine dinucleotide biosynthesis protein MobB